MFVFTELQLFCLLLCSVVFGVRTKAAHTRSSGPVTAAVFPTSPLSLLGPHCSVTSAECGYKKRANARKDGERTPTDANGL